MRDIIEIMFKILVWLAGAIFTMFMLSFTLIYVLPFVIATIWNGICIVMAIYCIVVK
jgi:hypothetical protein